MELNGFRPPKEVMEFLTQQARRLARRFLPGCQRDSAGFDQDDLCQAFLEKGWRASFGFRTEVRPELASGGLTDDERRYIFKCMVNRNIDLNRRTQSRLQTISLEQEPGSADAAQIERASAIHPEAIIEARDILNVVFDRLEPEEISVLRTVIEAGSAKAAAPPGVSVRTHQKRVRAVHARALSILRG